MDLSQYQRGGGVQHSLPCGQVTGKSRLVDDIQKKRGGKYERKKTVWILKGRRKLPISEQADGPKLQNAR